MDKNLFSTFPDANRITIPYTRPCRTYTGGPDSEPEEDIQEMWRRSRRHIKVFPDGENPRTLSRASSVATYQGSEEDYQWDDVCDEVDTDEFKRDREEVADWLLCSDPMSWHSPHAIDTLPVPFTPAHVGPSLFLQLVQALLLFLNLIPECLRHTMPIPDRFRKPHDREQTPDPDRRPISDQIPIPPILDNDDSLRYVIPDRRVSEKRHDSTQKLISIMVTKDWSLENMRYQPRDAPRIYRVLDEHDKLFMDVLAFQNMCFLRDIPRPVDEFDEVFLERHGQPSNDIGPYEERWHLVCADKAFLDYFIKHHRHLYLPRLHSWIRFFRGLWPWRKNRRTWVYRDRFNVTS